MSERQSVYDRVNLLPVTVRAERKVFGERAEEYGPVLADFERTARMWSEVLRCSVSAEQVVMCLIMVKASRLCFNPSHLDSVVDIAGYAEVLGLIQAERLAVEFAEPQPAPPAACPFCGHASPTPRETLRQFAAQELAVRCGECSRIAPALQWVDGKEIVDAARSPNG